MDLCRKLPGASSARARTEVVSPSPSLRLRAPKSALAHSPHSNVVSTSFDPPLCLFPNASGYQIARPCASSPQGCRSLATVTRRDVQPIRRRNLICGSESTESDSTTPAGNHVVQVCRSEFEESNSGGRFSRHRVAWGCPKSRMAGWSSKPSGEISSRRVLSQSYPGNAIYDPRPSAQA